MTSAPAAARALERASELAEREQWVDALAVLRAANRAKPDPVIEARLIELQSAARPPVGNGAKRWPPRTRDRYKRVAGIPEIDATQLTFRRARSAVFRHGALLVRGLLPEHRVTHLIEDIDRAFDAYDSCAGSGAVSAPPWFVPYEPAPGGEVPRGWIRNGDGVVAVDSPRALFDAIEAFDEAGIRQLATQFLEEVPMLLANKWTLRRVVPGASPHLDFHQDGAFLGPHVRLVNVWVSLSHCGVDAPGLDVVARRFNSVLGVGAADASLDWTLTEQKVQAIAGKDLVRPVFAPGDALIFDHLLVHRTAYDPAMTRDRYAIEAWFAAPSAAPANALPILY